jgi:hypothetical protein
MSLFFLEILGVSASWNLKSLSRPVKGLLYLDKIVVNLINFIVLS